MGYTDFKDFIDTEYCPEGKDLERWIEKLPRYKLIYFAEKYAVYRCKELSNGIIEDMKDYIKNNDI